MAQRPESVGLSSARLEQIDRHVQCKYIETGRMPGALTVVARKGEVAHLNAIGMADAQLAHRLERHATR